MIRACECTHLEDAHAPDGCMYCHQCEGFRDASTEWTGELRSLAEVGLRIIKKDLESTGSARPFFVLRHPDGSVDQLEVPEALLDAFNDGHAKDRIYGSVRKWVAAHDVNAVVMGSDAWFSRTTPAGDALGIPEIDRIMREEGAEECERRGLIVRKEAAMVNVQTPERVMTLTQVYERLGRRRIVFREVMQVEGHIDKFAGRQKMFGRLDREDIG